MGRGHLVPSGGVVTGGVLVAALGLGVLLGVRERDAVPRPGAGLLPRTSVEGFLEVWCAPCHGGDAPQADLTFARVLAEGVEAAPRGLWRHVARRVGNGEMPPPGTEAPPAQQIDRFLGDLRRTLEALPPLPVPHVTARRLNRAEYRHTVLDLLGVCFEADEAFPADDVGHGFDNVGDVLALPPALLEKYLLAAEQIAREALPDDGPGRPRVEAFGPDALQVNGNGNRRGAWRLYSQGEVYAEVDLPREGTYRLRVKAHGEQAGPEPARMAFQVDRRRIEQVDVAAVAARPEVYEVQVVLQGGRRRIGAAFTNDYYEPNHPDPSQRDRNLVVHEVQVMGPVDARPRGAAEARLLPLPLPASAEAEAAYVRSVLGDLARRAWRRPVSERDLDALLATVSGAASEDASVAERVRLGITALLVSPRFLFRIEPPPADADARRLDGFELATRLSYFLWSSMPDEALLARAASGGLLDDAGLEAECRRMLGDARATALAVHFAPQWLKIHGLMEQRPDGEAFPGVDQALLEDMRAETELFFEAVLREGRDVRELVGADFTFLNDRLAAHYGLPALAGPRLRRVPLPPGRLGGVLAHASVLLASSYPTRTSPVLRGKWVLETLLDDAPPPPPPGVGALEEGPQTAGLRLRERLARHREDPSCATCHARMDPLGFALEGYDAVGRPRVEDEGHAIDDVGTLPDGTTLEGAHALADHVRGERGFLTALARSLFTYALGRGLEDGDETTVATLARALEEEPTLERLILEIVQTDAFRMQGREREEGR